MADIDQLNIKIEADAQKAHSSVDTLINKLGRLNSALGGINTSNLTSLSNGIQRLSSSMQSMKNVGTADFTRLSKNIQKMGQLDSKQLGKAAGSIRRFVNALGTIDKINVSDNAAQIGQLAKGISQLGYKSSTQAIENIPKLATAMRQLMTELSKAPKVSQNLIQMTEALAKLGRTGASSGRAATSLGKALDSYTASTNRASKGSFSLSAAIGKVYAAYWLLFRAFGKIKDAIDISSQLTEVQNVVDVTFGNMSRKVEDFAKTSIEQFGMSELSLKQYASRFQAMGSAMGISGSSIGNANSFLNKQTSGYVGLSNSMADVSLNLTKLTADMASFYNVEQSAVAEDLASVFTGQTRPLRQYGLDLTEATLKEWALKNGLDADIKSMSQAEKTMLRYQYVMSNTGAAQGDFARTANTWANQVRILKQNFEQLGAVVGGTLINAFKPLVQALNSVMGKLIAFAETVSNALGKIFGWKYESGSGGAGTTGLAADMEDAADSAGGIADNTGKAAKNIDKMKNGLRSFDELKTISMPDDSSGSGSGSGSSGDSSGASGSGGQWVKQDSIFDDYKSSIDSLYGLGEYIGNALKGAMDSIKWDEIYEKARGFGTGLASFLNGLFEGKKGETLLGKVGKTIAGALNTVINASLGFTDTFDFEQFGLNLADSVNQFFNTFDFAGLADAIDGWVQGLYASLVTAVSNISWSDVIDGIKEFISNIDIKTVAIVIGALTIKKILGLHLAKTALGIIGTSISRSIASAIAGKLGVEVAANSSIGTVLATALSGKISAAFAAIGTTFSAGVKALFGSEAAKSALAFISPIAKAFTGITSIVAGTVTAVTSFVSMLKDGFSWVKEAIMGVGIALTAVGAVILGAPALVAAVVAGIVAAVATIVVVVKDNWDAIKGWFSSAGEWFNTKVITPVCNFFKGLWTSVSGFFKNLWTDITKVWTTASTWFKKKVITPVSTIFNGVCTRIGRYFEGCWLIVQAAWKIASTWFNDKVISPIKTKFGELKAKIVAVFKEAKQYIIDKWTSVKDWISTNVTEPIKTKFGEVKTKATTAFGEAKKAVVDKWKGMKTWFSNTVIDPVKSSFKTACDKIGGYFTSLWGSIKKGVATAFNSVISSIESAINGIVGGINTMLSGFNKVAKKAGEIVGKDYSGVAQLPKVSLPRIKGYEAGGFPDKYSLFMAGEHGIPEIAGTVGGKTAVAGGAEITGIKDAIYQASQQEIALLRQQNQLLQGILNKQFGITKNDIGRAAREYATEQYNRTGNNVFVF